MNSLIRLIAVCLLATFTSAAFAQEQAVVCGKPLKTEGPLSWAVYSKTPLPANLPDLYSSLRSVLDSQAKGWTAKVRTDVSGAFSDLQTGALQPADFNLGKDATTLPVKQLAFLRTARQFELPPEANAPGCQSSQDQLSLIGAGNFILLVRRSVVELNKDAFKSAAQQIKALEDQYDRYLFDGFPMFPWEALVNSAFLTDKSIANGPPRNMLVLMHPAAGLVGSIDSGTSSDTGGVLSVEPVGWIRYSSTYRHWYGASLLAVFPSDRPAGYGVAANYDNFKLGVTWHDDKNNEHDGLALFIGFDLYQFIGEQKRSYEDYKDKLKTCLEAGC